MAEQWWQLMRAYGASLLFRCGLDHDLYMVSHRLRGGAPFTRVELRASEVLGADPGTDDGRAKLMAAGLAILTDALVPAS